MAYTIKKDSPISEITEKSPQAIELLTEYGLSCATCFLNQFDTVEAGAQLHGMTKDEIEKMVTEINEVLEKET
jgi:hybrid cluster-associated redox disulfide protein